MNHIHIGDLEVDRGVSREITEDGGKVSTCSLDIRGEQAVIEMVDRVVADHGGNLRPGE